MMSTERLNKTSDRIKDGRRTMLETEELGVSILQDLHSQRQSLLHAHDTVTFYQTHIQFVCHLQASNLVLLVSVHASLLFLQVRKKKKKRCLRSTLGMV